MGSTLGAMFLGLSVLAAHSHPVPYESGTPTVISQIGRAVYGSGTSGDVLFYMLQAGTMLILVLAANTSFADFPRLASFHAEDNFMPRQLTKRGHRLVFSNGIIFLSVTSIVVLLVTDAKVDRLIPLYAIGVFTSFTLSQAGMARHHLREREPGWRRGLLVNGTGAVLSLIVDVIIAITKFTHGAWVIVVLVPVMVLFLVRLSRQYEMEAEQLEHTVSERFVDRMDAMLGRPETDPHGDPIPDADGLVKPQTAQTLLTCPLDTTLTVTRVLDQDKDFLRFIEHHNLKPGEAISVEERARG